MTRAYEKRLRARVNQEYSRGFPVVEHCSSCPRCHMTGDNLLIIVYGMFRDWTEVLTDQPQPLLDYGPLWNLCKDFWPTQVINHTRYFCYLYRSEPGPVPSVAPLPTPFDDLGDIDLTPLDAAGCEHFCDSVLHLDPVAKRKFLYE